MHLPRGGRFLKRRSTFFKFCFLRRGEPLLRESLAYFLQLMRAAIEDDAANPFRRAVSIYHGSYRDSDGHHAIICRFKPRTVTGSPARI